MENEYDTKIEVPSDSEENDALINHSTENEDQTQVNIEIEIIHKLYFFVIQIGKNNTNVVVGEVKASKSNLKNLVLFFLKYSIVDT